MGGSIGFTAIKDGRVFKMCRWTNSMPGLFKSIQVLQPEIDPEETERHFQRYMKAWLDMKKDWEKHGPEGPFELNMTTSYFGNEPDGMFPDGYGLVVMDYDRKKLYSMQGYCSFDHINTELGYEYQEYSKGNTRRIDEYTEQRLLTELKPLFDLGHINTLRFNINFGEDFKLLGKDEGGYFDKRNTLDVSGLDLRWGDEFETRYGNLWEELKSKFNPGSRIFNMDIFKRNKDVIPEFIWEALIFQEKQQAKKDHDTKDGRNPYSIWFDIIPSTEWEVMNFEEDYSGSKGMLQELQKHYKLEEFELVKWNEWIQDKTEEYDGELEEDEGEVIEQ